MNSSSAGKINLEVAICHAKSNVKLKDAMFVPLHNNLMSVASITDNEYTVSFDEHQVKIKRKDVSTALTVTRRNRVVK